MSDETLMECARAVSSVVKENGYAFSNEELEGVLKYTEQKCERAGKGEWYFPLLLETELRDYLFRRAVNAEYQSREARAVG